GTFGPGDMRDDWDHTPLCPSCVTDCHVFCECPDGGGCKASCDPIYGSPPKEAHAHACKQGPQIIYALPQGGCAVAGTTVPLLLRDSGDRYSWRNPGPPCDPNLKHERQ